MKCGSILGIDARDAVFFGSFVLFKPATLCLISKHQSFHVQSKVLVQ
jgi:hypothetical protein